MSDEELAEAWYAGWQAAMWEDGYRPKSGHPGFSTFEEWLAKKKEDDKDRRKTRPDVVMKRIWLDPVSALEGDTGPDKVVIEHYDRNGNIVTIEEISDWDSYCAGYNNGDEVHIQNRKERHGSTEKD